MVKFSSLKQSLVSIAVVLLLSVICHFLKEYIDYRIVALILFLAVSVLAVLFDILPVLIAAILSALILNLFFIEPVFNYKIRGTENVLLFFIFILVALVNAVLTNRLRKQEAKVRDKEEKEKTISLYNTLLSSLSHELKTPIATIIGAVDTLKDSGDKMTRDQRVDLYLEMEIAGSRLNKQVENLLNMSRLESGILRLKSNWQDLNELLYSLIRKIPNQENHKIVFIEDEKMPLFKLDIGLLETALYCVIENAVRYTPLGTEIKIFTVYEDEFLEIGISDNGKGIPEEEMTLVFEKFYRRSSAGSGGTGLGLSIAKGLIEAHNGNIILKKSPEGGAEFLIRIPTEVSYLKNLKNE